MDFKDIQSAWDNDNPNNVKLPTQLEKLQTAHTPLDKIRKNLKNEFFYQIIAIVFCGFAPFMHGFPASAVVPYYLLFSLFTAVSIYYLAKLFFFYKRLNKTTLNTKDSLYETYFDIRLNMELYKTFGFALTPFVVLFLVGFVFYKNPDAVMVMSGEFKSSVLFGLFFAVVFAILFMGLALEWWVHFFYGKYAKEIRKVIDELKEE